MKFLLALLVCFSFQNAQALELTDISEEDLETIVNDFSSNFAYTTVSGARSLGAVFGFEVAVALGVTDTPGLDSLSDENDPTEDNSALPHGGLVARVSVPLGITASLVSASASGGDGEFSHTGFGLKWTFSDVLLPIPMVDLAVRYHMSDTTFEYSQSVSNVLTRVDFDTKVSGLQLLAGINLPFFKPYAGVGTIEADGDLVVNGTDTIFDFTASTSATKKVSDTQMLFGVEIPLFILNLGFEYSTQFGNSRYTGKLGFAF